VNPAANATSAVEARTLCEQLMGSVGAAVFYDILGRQVFVGIDARF
jgi:hypothetical protein